jgi:sialate O-acetylesterase
MRVLTVLGICAGVMARAAASGAPQRMPRLLYTTFQDHAVLQRGVAVPVWGVSRPGATVTVRFAGETGRAVANGSGQWRTTLGALPAGGPYTLRAVSSAGTHETVTDVMVGDVYLCSGQSNMEYPTRIADGYDSAVRSAHNRMIRLFHVQRYHSTVPRSTFGAGARWRVVSPRSVRNFSAVCYLFGRALQPSIGVSVGLIEAAWGGSLIQAWIGPRHIRRLGGFGPYLKLLSVYQASPARAQRDWNRIAAAWWHAHDPASAAPLPWFSPKYDDSTWMPIVPNGTWREWNLPQLQTFNGIVWLRKNLTLPADATGKPARLSLGAIDQSDITYVNGIEVGASEGYDVSRTYPVPAGVLRAGRNVIAIGIFGGAGLLSPADRLSLRLAGGTVVPLSGRWRFKRSASMRRTGQIPHVPWLNQFGLTDLYNGMIRPLGRTRVRGIVWYQGESDADQPQAYARLLPALIRDWRGQFGSKTPFLIVQLPNFMAYHTRPRRSDWACLREVQRRVAAQLPLTGLAVTIDIGSRRTIHPADKADVGLRLALLARSLIYGQTVTGESPSPALAWRSGEQVWVRIDTHHDGLLAEESNRPLGFQLCNDRGCAFVDARQHGATIELNGTSVPGATRVRYCWDNSPICNLYDRTGLPAVPFEMRIKRHRSTSRARVAAIKTGCKDP